MAVTETTAYNPGKFEIPASSLNWKQLSPAHSAKWEEDTQGDIRLEVPQQICSASTVIVAHGRSSSLEPRGAKQGTSQPTPCFSLCTMSPRLKLCCHFCGHCHLLGENHLCAQAKISEIQRQSMSQL